MNAADVAHEFGFQDVFVLRPDRFIHYQHRFKNNAIHSGGRSLCADVQLRFPRANAILALIWPYTPFAETVPLCSNYIPANAAYQAAGHVLARLEEQGVYGARVNVPVRELLLRGGQGVALKNGLTAMPAYGTRFTIQTLAVELAEPTYDEAEALGACAGCNACVRACPAAAIGEDGFDFQKCLRAHMGKEVMPEWVMNRMTKMLGCEICQCCCPYNAGQDAIGELPVAFSPERLLQNDTEDAAGLIGANMASGGRLQAHAAVMAAHGGRRDLLPLLEAMREDLREPVRAAAHFAISRLRNEECMV